MIGNLLDAAGKFMVDGSLVLIGIAILIGVFVACFFLKTFWGQWDNRAKEDEIYGKYRKPKS